MAQVTKFSDQIRGDVFEEKTFELIYSETNTPIFLVDCTIRMQFRLRNKLGRMIKELSIGNGITIIDDELGSFKIDRALSFLDYADIYHYDLEVTFPRGEVKTYMQGTISVKQDVSY